MTLLHQTNDSIALHTNSRINHFTNQWPVVRLSRQITDLMGHLMGFNRKFEEDWIGHYKSSFVFWISSSFLFKGSLWATMIVAIDWPRSLADVLQEELGKVITSETINRLPLAEFDTIELSEDFPYFRSTSDRYQTSEDCIEIIKDQNYLYKIVNDHWSLTSHWEKWMNDWQLQKLENL